MFFLYSFWAELFHVHVSDLERLSISLITKRYLVNLSSYVIIRDSDGMWHTWHQISTLNSGFRLLTINILFCKWRACFNLGDGRKGTMAPTKPIAWKFKGPFKNRFCYFTMFSALFSDSMYRRSYRVKARLLVKAWKVFVVFECVFPYPTNGDSGSGDLISRIQGRLPGASI